MNNFKEIVIIAGVLIPALFFTRSTFGLPGSLDQLQNQFNSTYRIELVDYLLSHNMTVMDTQLKVNKLMNINNLETYQLEAVVKGHMNDCQTGTFQHIAETLNLSNAEISEKYGDC